MSRSWSHPSGKIAASDLSVERHVCLLHDSLGCVDLISVFVATGSNNSCVLLLGDVLCTIRFLLLSAVKLI
jgi:hypothetical protein